VGFRERGEIAVADDILKAVPEDVRDTYDYTVDVDLAGCDTQDLWEARKIARTRTLGQALVRLAEKQPNIKARIQMPEPRQKPWRNLPVLLIGGRPPPGILIRLDNDERANLLELLKACGYGTDGIEPFTFMRGKGWLGPLASKIVGDGRFDEPINEKPVMTFEELKERVAEWKKGGKKTRPVGWS
jgi:hypothetical protein